MSVALPPPSTGAAVAPAWLRWAPALAAVALVLVVFRDTAAAMVAVWSRSETFTHAFLVPPIALWLAWRQRQRLVGLPLRPVPWLLGAIAVVCAAWLVAEVASVNAASHFALVALLVLSVPAVAGWVIARQLAFPLLFLFFAVPMGDFLLPPMMEMTADFTVAALRLTGVPVYREGMQFMIPTGAWSVVEACSGVRYLIASAMVGTLFAYLNFRTLRRRLLFVLAALAVPIVANWVRAYGIVMLGHLSGNRIAVGVDHLLYGWVFFGVVVAVMFAIGARWAEPPADPAPAATAVATAPAAAVASAGAWAVAVGIAVLAASAQLVQDRLTVTPGTRGSPVVVLPEAGSGWQRAADALTTWEPSYPNPSAVARATYHRAVGAGPAGQGAAVGLWIGYYRDQDEQRKLVASVNTLVPPESKSWTMVERGVASTTRGGGGVEPAGEPVNTATLRDTADPRQTARQRLRVWQWYWIDGRFVDSPARAKLLTAWQRLRGAGDDGASVILFTPLGEESAAADAVLADFIGVHRGAIAAALQAARDGR